MTLGVIGGATAAGCASSEADDSGSGFDAVTTIDRALAIDEDVSVLVEHPSTLRALEQQGLDLGSRLTGTRMPNNQAFAASAEGKSIIAAVTQDVAEAKAGDRELGVGMNFNHRAFDPSWLSSSEATFELVGVTNRLDRRHATADACGETHLVYRLAYTNKQATSRLPMTVMLVYPQAKEGADCGAVAKRWLTAQQASSADGGKAKALLAGPLANLPVAPKVETNYQQVRWPSTTRKDMGGYAEYSLRVFARGQAGLTPVKIDNTPRTNLTPEERTALADWIGKNTGDIDRGIAKLPEEFLADKAISVSPKGLSRAQNRPFAVALGKDGAGLADIDLGNLALAPSKAALLRRLDTMTCNGCHQSQGIAGFHILGHDRPETSVANSLVEGVSAHTREQVAFRKADLLSVAGGSMELAPLPFAERALGSQAFAREGGYGSSCGLGDPGFARWTCASGLTCSDVNGDDVGMCVTAGKIRKAGESCETARVSFVSDPHSDKVDDMKALECALPSGAAGRCVRSGGDPGGFPTGLCGGPCAKLGKVEGTAICGVSVPSGFNQCIGMGSRFEDCSADGPKQYRLACSTKSPCGPDYVCAAATGAPAGVGACMPPYFIFQARVDGHLVDRKK